VTHMQKKGGTPSSKAARFQNPNEMRGQSHRSQCMCRSLPRCLGVQKFYQSVIRGMSSLKIAGVGGVESSSS
jgi:hypothetical protein